MAHTKSSIKDLRRIKKRTVRNVANRSMMRTFLSKARKAVDDKESDAAQRVEAACQILDKMVTKGIIKKNNSSRRKARLMNRLNLSLDIGKASALRLKKEMKEKARKEKPQASRERIEDVDAAAIAEAMPDKVEKPEVAETVEKVEVESPVEVKEEESSKEVKDDESTEETESAPEEKPE